jgi:glycosyltransferase involved in cell wall biosynthesis
LNLLPLITVVIPLYNGARYIRRSVQSVLQQSYTNFELIIVDDGSSDDGADIVLEFTDQRLRLVRQDNMGVSAARNKGISEGKGEYIAFLDADDEWDVGFLDAVVNLSNRYPQAGIYGTGYRLIFPQGPCTEITAVEAIKQETSLLVTDYFYREGSGCDLIHVSGVMIPRRIFGEVGVFKIGEHYGQDIELWARIALRYPLGYDTRILVSFYQTSVVNKPRFKKLPEYAPMLKTLEKALYESPDFLVNRERQVRSYIKSYLIKRCLLFINNDNRVATVVFMQNSNASIWIPLLNRLINIRPLWPCIRFAGLIYRAANSRLALKIIGGQRSSHDVLIKLRGAEKA